MAQLTIRCHPCVPVAAEQLEEWLADQVAQLRADLPHGTVRLSRLCQHLGQGDVPIGWLLELELFDGDSRRLTPRIEEALTDMRLLGLEPTVLTPVGRDGPHERRRMSVTPHGREWPRRPPSDHAPPADNPIEDPARRPQAR